VNALRILFNRSFPRSFQERLGAGSYALTPALRYHLRKTCTNLVQISDRAEGLGLSPLVPAIGTTRSSIPTSGTSRASTKPYALPAINPSPM
jgi:hypothetical protein